MSRVKVSRHLGVPVASTAARGRHAIRDRQAAAAGRLRLAAAALTTPGRLRLAAAPLTTPGRLRLAAVLLALGAIVFGFVAADAAGTRRHAVRDVATTEPLLVSAVDLSASLSDAHAIAAFSFLRGGPEPAGTRRLYDREMQAAGAGVAQIAREIGTSSRGGPAVSHITRELAVYAGLIDDARANYRQGFPVGSAYLRRASTTMRDAMLPAASDLYEIQARKLTTSYRAGVSTSTVLGVMLAGLALLALLVATQVYVARATRRIVNPRLALATAVLSGLMLWIVMAFATQRNRLVEAQRAGSDPVELLTVTRILSSRAQADESIALSARGGGGGEPQLANVDRGFRAVVRPIGLDRPGGARGSGGLLHEATVVTDHSTAALDAIYGAYRRYLEAHRRVVVQERRGAFTKAIKLAVGPGAGGSAAAKDALNGALEQEIAVAQGHFERAASHARSALGGLAGAIPLLTMLCATLALLGMRQRLVEYG
jgi:hypothetical protein